MRHVASRPPARVLPRVLLAALLAGALGLGCLVVLVAAGVVGPPGGAPVPVVAEPPDAPSSQPPAQPPAQPLSPDSPEPPGPRAVLAAWDRSRARAWEAGDDDALRRLYVPGAAAARGDVALLRRWTRQGLRVTGMRMRVLRLRVDEVSTHRLVLGVTDRLDDAIAVAATGAGPVPERLRGQLAGDHPTTRTLVLVRHGGPWRMASVSAPR